MKIGEFESVADTLAELSHGLDQAATREEFMDDPRRTIQYRVLAQHLAGAVAMVNVIENGSVPAS